MQPAMVHGYVKSNFLDYPNKSIITNANAHVGKKFVLNLDINDFFGSITSKHIYKVFRNSPFNFPEQLAAATSLLCTYNEKLPQGAPTSPVLSNFVFRQFDEKVFNFCQEFNITYSRYADDLTFSTNELAFEITATTTFINQIEKYLSKGNFKLNEEKICLRTDKQKQIVTGIKVNKKLNLERHYKKQVRAMLHDYKKNGLEKAAEKYFTKWLPSEKVDAIKFLEILKGKLAFIESVEKWNNKK
jgi:RNA-directed DNA polymerase